MPKNVMKLLKRTPNNSRNSFDLSHRHLMTANFGELIPATCIETVPGDYIEFRVSDLLRACPMVTSPFMRVKQHFDVWFTPYEDLWSNFESFMTQKYEPRHSNNLGGFSYLPHVSLYTLGLVVNDMRTHSDTDVVGRPAADGAAKLLDYLGYGRLDSSGGAATHPSVNLFRLAQYNKIWYDEYRQNYYDNGLRFMTDGDFALGNGVSNPSVIFNFDDMPCYSESDSNIFASGSSKVVADLADARYNRLKDMIQMRYRCWKKDLFTGVMPSTQFGDVSFIDVTSDKMHMVGTSYFRSVDSGSYEKMLQTGTTGYVQSSSQSAVNPTNSALGFQALRNANGNMSVQYLLTGDPGGSSVNDYLGLDVLALRKSEAIQIWRERALTAGNRVGDNMRAHYGDDVDYNDHRSTYLGSVDAPLNISDINSTAQTGQDENGSLGDVAGKGLSSLDEKVFKFKAKKFGCIMVMFSLLPETEYESYGVDRMNQLLEAEDFFIPEYENLGLEAVSSQNFYHTLTTTARIMGYAPRYYGYKQKLDKAYGEFRGNGLFSHWASPKTDVSEVLSSAQTSGSVALPLQLLYVNPALYDRNFAVGVDNSDQVICDFFFECSAVRQMSVSGLPNY